MSTLGSTWGAYVVIGCLGESELLLGGDMQECQDSSQREHDVRTQNSTLPRPIPSNLCPSVDPSWFNVMSAAKNTHTIQRKSCGSNSNFPMASQPTRDSDKKSASA